MLFITGGNRIAVRSGLGLLLLLLLLSSSSFLLLITNRGDLNGQEMKQGSAIAQAVNRTSPTAAALVPRYDEQNGFLRFFLFPL
jgi:hypothetical protein